MTPISPFRDSGQEIISLLEECAELKRTLAALSAQISRIETRVKRAFPVAAVQVRERKIAKRQSSEPTLTPEQALLEFDKVVKLAASGAHEEAERILEVKTTPDLLLMARELGVSLSNSKPSAKVVKAAIIGKVRESLLLTRHSARP